jgi:hypothetical protein
MEVIHHVTRYSREISCGATGQVQVEETARLVTCEACVAADYAKLVAEAERQAYAEQVERDHALALTWNDLRDAQGQAWSTGFINAIKTYRQANSVGLVEARRGAIDMAHGEALEMARDWRERVYRRAVKMNAAAPHMGHAEDAMLDELHAEALREDGERYAAGCIAGQVKADATQIIAASRAPEDATGTGLPEVPADLDDDAAWAVYCAAMPDPTDQQIADVLAEYGDPYAAPRADAVDGFKNVARTLWRLRADIGRSNLHEDIERNLRASMRTFRGVIEVYDQLTESWALATRTERDAYSQTF